MNAKARAEKIVREADKLLCDRSSWREWFKKEIAAQIEAAEREARDSGIRSGKEEALKEWTKPFNDAYAEGFRAGQEEYKALHPGVARDLVTYQAGFTAAREKAKGIAETHCRKETDYEKSLCKEIAQRIGEMEP